MFYFGQFNTIKTVYAFGTFSYVRTTHVQMVKFVGLTPMEMELHMTMDYGQSYLTNK